MLDQQVDELIEVLKDGRIFAVNAGENGEVTKHAWRRLAYALPDTKLGFMFVEVRRSFGLPVGLLTSANIAFCGPILVYLIRRQFIFW